MSSNQTLNSRLRVLVAKTFRAEKGYASMKNSNCVENGEIQKLAEFANTVRADVWQQAHAKLRRSLNDILSKVSGPEVIESLVSLRDSFLQTSQQSKSLMERSRTALLELAAKDEFAHTFKSSLELIRFKAQMQASQIIADELTAITQSSRKEANHNLPEIEMEYLASDEDNAEVKISNNVVPFRRRVAGASGRH